MIAVRGVRLVKSTALNDMRDRAVLTDFDSEAVACLFCLGAAAQDEKLMLIQTHEDCFLAIWQVSELWYVQNLPNARRITIDMALGVQALDCVQEDRSASSIACRVGRDDTPVGIDHVTVGTTALVHSEHLAAWAT